MKINGILLFFIFLMLFFLPVNGASDDITMMGSVSPDGTELSVTIDNAAALEDRVLIRFFVTNVPNQWGALVTDKNRLYGSYLPVAEILLPDGSILSPSSASSYSLLEFNNTMIIGGLLQFETESVPNAFLFNFNQIPFDTSPLAQGFSQRITLETPSGSPTGSGERLSTVSKGLEFTLTATAQTNGVSMIQPAVRLERADEYLSKFGWVSVLDTKDNKRYPLERESLYGFNLTNDEAYFPAHAFVFAPISSDTPLVISMDHAYVVRSFAKPLEGTLLPEGPKEPVLLDTDGLYLKVSKTFPVPEEEKIRIYFDCGNTVVSDLNLHFPDFDETFMPSVECGIDPPTNEFACDIFFEEHSFPSEGFRFSLLALEYKKDGPWEIEWHPAIMTEEKEKEAAAKDMPFIDSTWSAYPTFHEQPDPIPSILEKIDLINKDLISVPGWISEKFEQIYTYGPDHKEVLIPVGQSHLYLTHYVSENYYRISDSGTVDQKVSVIRTADTGIIQSATLEYENHALDILHATISELTRERDLEFKNFPDFREIIDSSASFTGKDDCGGREADKYCLHFTHSLSGVPGSPGSQVISFTIDENSGFIEKMEIGYDKGALHLEKRALELSPIDELPKDILELTEGIK